MNGTRLGRLIEQLGREMARQGLKAVSVRYRDKGTLQAEVVADKRAASSGAVAASRLRATTSVRGGAR